MSSLGSELSSSWSSLALFFIWAMVFLAIAHKKRYFVFSKAKSPSPIKTLDLIFMFAFYFGGGYLFHSLLVFYKAPIQKLLPPPIPQTFIFQFFACIFLLSLFLF
jgi:hypothetical protein